MSVGLFCRSAVCTRGVPTARLSLISVFVSRGQQRALHPHEPQKSHPAPPAILSQAHYIFCTRSGHASALQVAAALNAKGGNSAPGPGCSLLSPEPALETCGLHRDSNTLHLSIALREQYKGGKAERSSSRKSLRADLGATSPGF